MAKFWERLGEGTAELWTAHGFGPALIFWGVGLAAWVWRYGWTPLHRFLASLDPTVGFVLAVGLLAGVVASGTVMTWLQPLWLRLAAGHWPWPFSLLGRVLVARLNARLSREEDRWQELQGRKDMHSRNEEELARLDALLALYPANPAFRSPTRLGNLLRAAVEHSLARYGLVFDVTWPRLWLLLPQPVRDEIADARRRMDERLTLMGWAALLGVWVLWAWWALPLALAAAVAAYWATWAPAAIYGDLVRAAYDLYHLELYRTLGWDVPKDPAAEWARGQKLTEFLFRGPALPPPTYPP